MNTEKRLYQWDTGQKLVGCTGLYVDFPIGTEVYRVETTDGMCIIPDELLQTSGGHKVYECMTNNTIRSFAFSVTPRPKPPDYVYTPTERLTFEGLVQKVDDAVADMIRRAESGEFDGYTPVKGKDYFTTEEIQQIQNEVSSGAIGEFKSVVDTETETFNNNAETKLIAYNQNDSEKTASYNANATKKLNAYNTNANNRLAEFDAHTGQIQTDVSELKSDLTDLTKVDVTWTNGYRLSNGAQVAENGWYITDYIELRDDILFQLSFTVKNINTLQSYCIYDKNKNYIEGYSVGSDSYGLVSGITNITDYNAKYIRFCSFDSDGKHSISISNLNGLKLRNEFVKSEYLADKCVTVDKCDFIAHDPESNYIDTTKITNGYYIASNGSLKPFSSYAVTDYTEVEPLKTYYGYHLLSGYCAFYDEDKNYVIGYDYNTFPFPITVPEGCKYARFSTNIGWWADTSQIWLYTENIKPNEYAVGLTIPMIEEEKEVNPCEYDGDEICVFRKGLCIGDSLTEGVFNYVVDGNTSYLTDKTKSYPSKLAMLTGIEITNKGHGGLTSTQWYNAEKDTDLSGYDFCIIQLGVNDSIYNSGWTQESITAFTNIINKVKTENTNIKIYVATIMPAKSYSGTNIDAVSQGIRDLVTSLDDSNVILLDMAIYAHTNDSDAYNCGHLSELGYYRLAKDYKNYISYHISKNIMQYQQIQFVGTDHVYS